MAAYVTRNVVPTAQVQTLIFAIHAAFANATAPTPAGTADRPKPKVPILNSVTHRCIRCLEDGLKFKSLKRHLTRSHGITPERYREKRNLTANYPMVAPQYAEARTNLARSMGLGRKQASGKK